MSKADFDGQIVIVTGGSTGLGRAIAVEVADRGAKAVIVNYARSAREAEETADKVRSAGAEAILAQGDVGQDGDCAGIAEFARPFGRVDALFNNAGTTVFAPDHSKLDAVSADDFLRIYRVNVVGAYQMIRAARALLEAAPAPGAVVNTASIAAILGIGTSVPYAASKGAMKTMTLSLARALAPKIRVNAILPGFIDTPWFEKANMPTESMNRMRENVAATTPLRVASQPEDIAAAAVFLASPAARHITGESLVCDAGTHMGFANQPLAAQAR
ncbi:MAG: SDR family NAD(P)-dependent oxidoreductase [Hyphomonadaceae bacterium]